MKKLMVCLAFALFVTTLEAQNYDESKVPAYALPDLLKTAGNRAIKNKSQWEKIRRPEILALFEDNVYGQMPKLNDSIKFTVSKESGALNGKARMKEVEIAVWRSGRYVRIQLILFFPGDAKKPAPLFLLINNRGKENTDPSRKIKSEFWPVEMLIDSGYAIGAFHVDDAAPDNKDHYKEAALQLFPEQSESENGMKAIGAWAWAASRSLDYLVKDPGVDPKKICIVGHSRGGKAALWAGAEDQRFAIVFSNCSGNSGAAISRRKFGETIKAINETFPYWFCNNYKKYNDNEDALPVDQHMLIALMAPRPVYVTSASKDLWADPVGSYQSLLQARQVYALYGTKIKLPAVPPPVNSAVIHSVLGYHNREGIHNLTSFDWANFIRFANYHFKGL